MDEIPTPGSNQNPISGGNSLSPVVVFAVVSALGAILIVTLAHRFGLITDRQVVRAVTAPFVAPDRTPVTAAQLAPVVPALPEHLPPVDAALATMVAQGVAQLGLKPKTVVLPNEQALEEIADIKQGDYAAATRLAEDVLAHSSIDGWHFTPFEKFMGSLTHGNDPLLLDHLNEWVRQEPNSALAYLMRGQYFYQTGWTLRTEEVGSKIPRDIYALFEEDLRLSAADMRTSIGLNPRIPWSYFRLLCAVSGDGNSSAVQAAFETAIKAYPQYYELYRFRLYMLTPKWGGSLRDMHALVAHYAGGAPAGSPLKLLYLQEYADLLNAAWFDCGSDRGDRERECVDDALKSQGMADDVNAGVIQALNLYKVSDPIYFSNAIWPILSDLASTPSGSASGFGETLQTAATIMGSDNRLTHTPGHNSYVLDDVTGQVWAQLGNHENAEQKYREALADIEQTAFHDEAERDQAMAKVLDHLALLAQTTSQFTNIIVYYDAAVMVGGVNFTKKPHLKCFAYIMMKHGTEAVSECSRVIQANNNYVDPQYFLGRAYEILQQWDNALVVFEPVALSADNWRRVGAAISMSVEYGKKKDYAGELKSLNEHGYLFDTRMQAADDLAAAYNNRCHALMELGRLQDALDDCNVALKYGQLPDTIHKQKELMRRLAEQGKST